MFDLIEKTHKFIYPKYRLQVMDGDMVLPIAPQISTTSTLSLEDEERLERNDIEKKMRRLQNLSGQRTPQQGTHCF